MRQVTRFKNKKRVPKSRNIDHIGTSKLETKFANNILELFECNYIYQYEVLSIGKVFDFALTDDVVNTYEKEIINEIKTVKRNNELFKPSLLIEVDGDYFHSNPKFYTNKQINFTQIKSRKNDRKKNLWALENGIVLLRFWEDDVNNNPQKVIKELSNYFRLKKKR